jgi:cytochrome P450
MTFGYGPHSCLGYRFALAEIKIFIASLLPHFEFSQVEDVKILKFNSILTRPFISGKWSSGTQLPLRIRQVK